MHLNAQHQYLVFTSAGDHANVRQWLKGKANFDLWITYYGKQDNPYQNLTPFHMTHQGGKFPNLHTLHTLHPDFLKQYKAIMVMDDDIIIKTRDINRLFEIRDQLDVSLLQPAFDRQGKISHPITRRRYKYHWRYTNFVEVTCPLFETTTLLDFLTVSDPTLNGWGVDYWFMHHLMQNHDIHNKVAIIDDIACINPHDAEKPGQQREINRLQTPEARMAHWQTLAKQHGIPVNGHDQQTFNTVEKNGIQRSLASLNDWYSKWRREYNKGKKC